MKIGVNSRLYQNFETGIPKFIRGLYTYLQTFDTKNKYIFFQTSNFKKLGKTKIINLPQNILTNILFDNFLINKLIKEERIDLFHGPSHIIPLIKIGSVKYVTTIHDVHFLYKFSFNKFLFNIYYKNFVTYSIQKSDAIVVDSFNSKKDICEFFKVDETKIKVIYPGVDDIFSKKNTDPRLFPNRYFLALTTHPERKNIYRILKIMHRYKKQFDNLKFIIAGFISKVEGIKLKKIIETLGLKNSVVVFGYATKKQLANLYQNAEFFVYPSYYEGFGFPVLEAMASGCPVITSNTSSLPELMPNKDWLINPYDEKNIADKMIEILSLTRQERERLVNKNFYFVKRFTWKKTAGEYLKVFNSLI
ncbi:glycosyltransferase family 4 protein [Candidatus Roizmanbacteria bacterium]|nr:glycosyltransferase family 4 protein [Candidatus Roizmanbacteria bacterium]